MSGARYCRPFQVTFPVTLSAAPSSLGDHPAVPAHERTLQLTVWAIDADSAMVLLMEKLSVDLDLGPDSQS